jgi:predicted regulator of Ras-like GTPase activity (Roadblock/LC7/MglB family)
MSFQESLSQLCQKVDGALAASIMGYDGIAVESHEVDPGMQRDVNVAAAMVEYSNIFGQVRAAAAQLQAGEASEFSVRTEKLAAIGRMLNSDYFVVVALAPEGNLGKARYVLRVGAGKLTAEL